MNFARFLLRGNLIISEPTYGKVDTILCPSYLINSSILPRRMSDLSALIKTITPIKEKRKSPNVKKMVSLEMMKNNSNTFILLKWSQKSELKTDNKSGPDNSKLQKKVNPVKSNNATSFDCEIKREVSTFESRSFHFRTTYR